MCWTTNGNTHSKRCINIHMDTINSIEFNNRFTGDSESDFNNNLHGDGHRCERMYSINTSDGECKSATCSYRCTATCNMCGTTDSNTDSKRCINIHMDTINKLEFNDRFTGYSQSDINNNLHGDGHRCERMYCINTSDGECKSAAC